MGSMSRDYLQLARELSSRLLEYIIPGTLWNTWNANRWNVSSTIHMSVTEQQQDIKEDHNDIKEDHDDIKEDLDDIKDVQSQFSIIVKLDAKSITLNVTESTTIQKVKDMIEEKALVTVGRLCWNGRELTDGDLSDWDIDQNFCTLEVLPIMQQQQIAEEDHLQLNDAKEDVQSQFNIIVRIDKRSIILNVTESTTIQKIKEMIEQKTGITVGRLYWGSRELSDGELSDWDIGGNFCTLEVLPNMQDDNKC
ncbi:polyubiquitin-like [Dysidea avara]|uniref:polyubiquitin-like n=1 Tax=Dysidea avara TaxID=196820 RepID=UPI00331FC121